MGHVHRLIAFDLDGTLIDSRRDLADAANDLLTELGGAALPEADITRMVGEGAALLVRRALIAAQVDEPPDAVARFLDYYDRRLLNHTRPYPGIPEVLRAARQQARLVVLTNKPRRPSEQILEGLGLRAHFDEVVGGDGPLPRKPDPAALLALMDSAGADETSTLMVGDSPIDFRTAMNARVQCCIVSFGFGFEHFSPEDRSSLACVAADGETLGRAIATFTGAA